MMRYGALALAALVFFVAIFFMFQTLFSQKELIERQSRVNIWFLAQTEIEYLNMIEALDRFVIGDADATKENLEQRFELLTAPALVAHRVGPGSAQITDRFVARVGHMHRSQFSRPMAARQLDRIAPVGLDPFPRLLRDERRRHYRAIDPELL